MFAEEKGPTGKEEEEAAQHGEEGFSSALDDSTQQETLVPIYFFKSQQLECVAFF
jgi:hypothetical protein